MRSPAARLLMVMLAMCVGIQSTASAMGMRCTKAGMSLHAMPAGMHHGGQAPHVMELGDAGMPPSGMAPYGHHGDLKTSKGAKGTLGGLVCSCGAACAMAGCIGPGPAFASSSVIGVYPTTRAEFAIQEHVSALRAAHGLDLIRPPSRS